MDLNFTRFEFKQLLGEGSFSISILLTQAKYFKLTISS